MIDVHINDDHHFLSTAKCIFNKYIHRSWKKNEKKQGLKLLMGSTVDLNTLLPFHPSLSIIFGLLGYVKSGYPKFICKTLDTAL